MQELFIYEMPTPIIRIENQLMRLQLKGLNFYMHCNYQISQQGVRYFQ